MEVRRILRLWLVLLVIGFTLFSIGANLWAGCTRPSYSGCLANDNRPLGFVLAFAGIGVFLGGIGLLGRPRGERGESPIEHPVGPLERRMDRRLRQAFFVGVTVLLIVFEGALLFEWYSWGDARLLLLPVVQQEIGVALLVLVPFDIVIVIALHLYIVHD